MTLYDQWQADHDGDFATGVRLLHERDPKLVTKPVLEKLIQFATTGKSPDEQYLGKLKNALKQLPADRADIEQTVTLIVGSTGTQSTTYVWTAPLKPYSPPKRTEEVVNQATDPGTGKVCESHISAVSDDKSEDIVVKATPETIALHKLHSHHHALMVAATTDEERAKHAAIIMEDILPELDRLYDLQRGLETPKKPTSDEKTDIPGALRLKLQTVRSRISIIKNKEMPKAKTAARRADLETQLAQKEAEKKRLEDLIA